MLEAPGCVLENVHRVIDTQSKNQALDSDGRDRDEGIQRTELEEVSVVDARRGERKERRSCSVWCSSDQGNMDYVSDSEASSDEDDGTG